MHAQRFLGLYSWVQPSLCVETNTFWASAKRTKSLMKQHTHTHGTGRDPGWPLNLPLDRSGARLLRQEEKQEKSRGVAPTL